MELFLILIYIALNIIILWIYFKKNKGSFQAPFIMAGVSLGIISPQLTTFYLSPYYDNKLIWLLSYVMITGNLFFVFGFEKGKMKYYGKNIITLRLNNSLEVINLMSSALGIFSIFIYRGANIDFVIGAFFKSFAHFSFFLSLVFLIKKKQSIKIYLSLVLSFITVFNFAFLIKGSRTDSFVLGISILLYLSYISKKQKMIKWLSLVLILFGSVISANITMIRHTISGIGKINKDVFFDTYVKSFSEAGSEQTLGMDIANAAIGINYCFQNNEYDFGLGIWNGFVFNYVPRRVVGEKTKNSLYYKNGYTENVPIWTHEVTTMTGYASAFASFSFFSFIIFYFIGYIYGFIWKYSINSSYYLLLYFWLITILHTVFTHETQYFFGRVESFFIFFFPVFFLFGCIVHKKKMIVLKK